MQMIIAAFSRISSHRQSLRIICVTLVYETYDDEVVMIPPFCTLLKLCFHNHFRKSSETKPASY